MARKRTFIVENTWNWEFEPENVTDFNRFDTGDTWLIEVNRLGSVHPQHEEVQDAQ